MIILNSTKSLIKALFTSIENQPKKVITIGLIIQMWELYKWAVKCNSFFLYKVEDMIDWVPLL